MTVIEAPRTDPRSPRRPASGRTGKWGWRETMIMLIAVVGVSVLVYPSATAWFSAQKHHTEVDGYVRTVTSNPVVVSQLLEDAQYYNETLPSGPLRDAYALGADGTTEDISEGNAAYLSQLAVPGTEAMARIRIPTIDVDLPVYHGTSENTLARGVGHLYGSSLMIGGPGAHAVLSAHTGYVGATLFDDLDEVNLDDIVVIDVLGQALYYKVDQIQVLLPHETDTLRREPGKDYLSLVTCTPTGVNSHRLVVRAVRTEAPATVANDGVRTIANAIAPAGFPWWAVILAGSTLAAYFAARPRRPRPARRALTHSGRPGDPS